MKTKSLYIILLILINSLLGSTATGQEMEDTFLKKYDIAHEYSFLSEPITRGDTLAAIAKIIGIPKEIPEWLIFSTDTSMRLNPIVKTNGEDISVKMEITKEEFETYQKYMDDVGNYLYYYLDCLYTKILYGDENHCIYVDREVTLKEAVAFIMRCLEDANTDIDYTFNRAKEIGLISQNDNFFTEDGDSVLGIDDYCVLLNRMLMQKRYLYIDANEEERHFIWLKDEERSITYLDFLSQR